VAKWDESMTKTNVSSVRWMVAVVLSVHMVCSAAAGPAAPTIQDAQQYFESLVNNNSVTALYETRDGNGNILGYERFAVDEYRQGVCASGITLLNGTKVEIDWSVVEKTQISDGALGVLHGHTIQFLSLHMVSVEGGIVIEPSNSVARLIFGISDELSRNRLAKAMDLLSTACRSKSKFD
jgi:hypothetical protein